MNPHTLVGLDMDGVCFDFHQGFLPFFNERNKTSFRHEEVTEFDWFKCLPGINKKVFYDTLNEFDKVDLWGRIPLYEGVAEALREAIAAGIGFVGITVRRNRGPITALEQLEAAGVELAAMVSVDTQRSSKAQEALRHKIIVHFEDHPKYCEQVAAAGIPVFCIDQRYNQAWVPPAKLPITRAKDLPAALRGFRVMHVPTARG